MDQFQETMDRFEQKVRRIDLSELKSTLNQLQSSLLVLQGTGGKIVSVSKGNLMKTKRHKISILRTAIHVRENGISKQTLPSIGDMVTITGTFKGRDFTRSAMVTSVGETIFGTNDGWKFFARHDGWISASYPEDLKAIL